MNRRFIALMAVLLGAGAALLPASAQSNLLRNPSFEGGLSPRFDPCENRVANELGTPDGWEPFFKCRVPSDPDYTNFRPEFGTIPADPFKDRVRSGATALKYFNFFARNESAGVFQRVTGLASGQWLEFSLWTQLWTSNCDASVFPDNTPTSLYEPGNLEARVCIDTDGGSLDFDSGTVCSSWSRERTWDKYAQSKVIAQAAAGEVNVLLNTRAEWPVKHNDTYADDASLIAIAAPVSITIPNAKRQWIPAVFNESTHPNPEPAPRCPKPRTRILQP